MTVSAPETALRSQVIAALNKEFETESIGFVSDKLHDSLGTKGPVGGVYPGPSEESFSNGLVLAATCFVQLFLPWRAEVNPNQSIDPSQIEEAAERVRRACQADDAVFAGSPQLWYYRVVRVDYPPDPSGNITRLLATVQATAQNSALLETTG